MDWTLEPVFGSYAIVWLVAAGLFVILFLLKETGRVTRRQAFVLWSLRLLMCLIVILVLLKPGLTFTRQSTPRGTIAVMIDASASMQFPSGESKSTRWQLEREIWEALYRSRDSFGKDAVLSPFLYDSILKPLLNASSGTQDAPSNLPERAEGLSTDVGGPLNQLMSVPMEAPLSSVIWMGDGTQTHSPSGGDAQQMARRLAQIDVPMYIVGIGPRSESESILDLSVSGVPEQLDVFTKNPVNIRGILHCRGVANRELIVKLLLTQPGKAPREISLDRIRPTKADQEFPFKLPLTLDAPGAFELTVRAEPVEGEAGVENNEATVFVNVRGGGVRILYIEGDLRHEIRFIKSALSQSGDMQMFTRWIPKPSGSQKWPQDLSQQLADGTYDCFILGDIDYNAIGLAGATAIAEQVKKGAGLITLGGFQAYGAGGWDQSPLRDILPVKMGGQRRQDISKSIEPQNHLPGPLQVIPIGANEILQIDTPEKNAATWQLLKPLDGANRWEGVKSPGTILLAQSQFQQPLIVAGVADKGRVISLAFNSTYLWARQGQSDAHKAFWRKIIYWCLRRDAVEEGMQLSMPQRRLPLTSESEMILQWNGGSESVEMPPKIQLHLWKLGNSPAGVRSADQDLGEVQMLRRDEKSMRAKFSGSKEGGKYEWRANVTGSKGQPLTAKLPFVVIDQTMESMQPMPDWQLLNQMAKLNASAGGMLVAPEQTDEIVRQILERRKQSTQTAIEHRRLGDGALDTWTAFFLLAMVMIGQWTLRKKWNLP